MFDCSVDRDLYSWNIMLGEYVRTGDMDRALEWFDRMPERDVVSWSTVIAGYVQVVFLKEKNDCLVRMLCKSVLDTSIKNIVAMHCFPFHLRTICHIVYELPFHI